LDLLRRAIRPARTTAELIAAGQKPLAEPSAFLNTNPGQNPDYQLLPVLNIRLNCPKGLGLWCGEGPRNLRLNYFAAASEKL
jgi:hypothetical protein